MQHHGRAPGGLQHKFQSTFPLCFHPSLDRLVSPKRLLHPPPARHALWLVCGLHRPIGVLACRRSRRAPALPCPHPGKRSQSSQARGSAQHSPSRTSRTTEGHSIQHCLLRLCQLQLHRVGTGDMHTRSGSPSSTMVHLSSWPPHSWRGPKWPHWKPTCSSTRQPCMRTALQASQRTHLRAT